MIPGDKLKSGDFFGSETTADGGSNRSRLSSQPRSPAAAKVLSESMGLRLSDLRGSLRSTISWEI